MCFFPWREVIHYQWGTSQAGPASTIFPTPSPGCHLAKNHAIFYPPQFLFKQRKSLGKKQPCLYTQKKTDTPLCVIVMIFINLMSTSKSLLFFGEGSSWCRQGHWPIPRPNDPTHHAPQRLQQQRPPPRRRKPSRWRRGILRRRNSGSAQATPSRAC